MAATSTTATTTTAGTSAANGVYSGQAKNWTFTIHATPVEAPLWEHCTSDPLDLWNSETMHSIFYQIEKAPSTGQVHAQGFVCMKRKCRLTGYF